MQNKSARFLWLILTGTVAIIEAMPPSAPDMPLEQHAAHMTPRPHARKKRKSLKHRLTKRRGSDAREERASKREDPAVFLSHFASRYQSEFERRKNTVASREESTLHKAIEDGDEDTVATLLQLPNRSEEEVVYVDISQFRADSDLGDVHDSGESEAHDDKNTKLAAQRREILRGEMPSLVDERDRFENTPLYYAALYAQLPIVRLLLANGADPNLPAVKTGFTPLHAAAELLLINAKKADFEAVEPSLPTTAEADFETVAQARRSALRNVILNKRMAIIRELVNAGATANCKSDQGSTPLHIAATTGMSPEIVQYLITKADARVNERDKKGRTAYYYATLQKQADVADLLERHKADTSTQYQRGDNS